MASKKAVLITTETGKKLTQNLPSVKTAVCNWITFDGDAKAKGKTLLQTIRDAAGVTRSEHWTVSAFMSFWKELEADVLTLLEKRTGDKDKASHQARTYKARIKVLLCGKPEPKGNGQTASTATEEEKDNVAMTTMPDLPAEPVRKAIDSIRHIAADFKLAPAELARVVAMQLNK